MAPHFNSELKPKYLQWFTEYSSCSPLAHSAPTSAGTLTFYTPQAHSHLRAFVLIVLPAWNNRFPHVPLSGHVLHLLQVFDEMLLSTMPIMISLFKIATSFLPASILPISFT